MRHPKPILWTSLYWGFYNIIAIIIGDANIFTYKLIFLCTIAIELSYCLCIGAYEFIFCELYGVDECLLLPSQSSLSYIQIHLSLRRQLSLVGECSLFFSHFRIFYDDNVKKNSQYFNPLNSVQSFPTEEKFFLCLPGQIWWLYFHVFSSLSRGCHCWDKAAV